MKTLTLFMILVASLIIVFTGIVMPYSSSFAFPDQPECPAGQGIATPVGVTTEGPILSDQSAGETSPSVIHEIERESNQENEDTQSAP